MKGRFSPQNPEKYIGDPTNIIYRSSWEKIFCNWCDRNTSIKKWNSEEKIVPYFDPVKKRWRRYFPDFMIHYENKDGIMMTEMIEVKPQHEVEGPPTNPKRRTKGWVNQVYTYITNQAKWEAAKEYCENQGWSFRIITEKELGIKNK